MAAAPLPGAGLGIALARGAASPDLRVWQARMAQRGWKIRADGVFGPVTDRVLRNFQSEKGLSRDGVLGVQTWKAAWEAPVTR